MPPGHGDVDRTTASTRDGHGHTEIGVKGVGGDATPRTRDAGVVLSAKHVVHCAVVALEVLGQRVGRYVCLSPRGTEILQTNNKLIGSLATCTCSNAIAHAN